MVLAVPEPDLAAEERAYVERCLRKAGAKVSREAGDKLVRSVARATATYQNELCARSQTQRKVENAVRALWHLARQEAPPIGQIRARIRGLGDQVIKRFDYLARQEIPRYYDDTWPSRMGACRSTMPPPEAKALQKGGFREWAQVANDDALIWAVQILASHGEVLVLGRSRGDNKRSRPTIEPYIQGVARGAGNKTLPAGRSSDMDIKLLLIGSLFDAWERATGGEPEHGRSDHTGFGDLVHGVFQWLGNDDAAEYALRRFWEEVAKG